ncbi:MULTISPECIES: ABC transporter permease [Paenibacillus]|uniref:Transport permease protein n=1 Tax=Paenibacillus odorifer TaxID=189426 RepID=A0A1R0Z8E9_9BACL|nr:ABC transporter permease [Paenibacillus odorifer]OME64383.1 teichoic acid ABC transporter permease [Paenibacillus odorifer]
MKAITLLKEFNKSRDLIFKLAKNDFWTKYASSQLGIFWAFVSPLLTVLVYWFVFQIGFRVVPIENVPYLLWLLCGLVPWFFFSEALINSTNSLLEYSYLVKKVVFKISILPMIKIISSLFIHLFFLVFIEYAFVFYGFIPTVYNIQILYYLFCIIALLVSLSYLTSSIVVFFRDLSQLISIIMQFGVWLTPIMWQPNMFPEKYQNFLKINPLYYIVEGYRDSLFNNVWFWQKPKQTILFWSICLVCFALGSIVFKKLKPHFSDVL